MKKIIAALTLGIALSACTPTDIVSNTGSAPAPLQKTVIDEKRLIDAWSAFDLALTTFDVLVATNKLTPGSDKAKTIAGHLETAQIALNAATAAQKAGSAISYATAVAQANKARQLASALLEGN